MTTQLPSAPRAMPDALGCLSLRVNQVTEGIFSSFLPVKKEMTLALLFMGRSGGAGVEYHF